MGQRVSWGRALTRRALWLRALKLGLPVGMAQVAINHGDAWLTHTANGTVVLKSILSPLLSITIALFAAVATDVQPGGKP